MKIRTRIFASNTVMVLLALVVLLTVSAGLLRNFEPHYNEAAQRVMGEDVFKVEGYVKALPDGPIDYEALTKELASYNYSTVVLKGNEVVYSAVDENTLAFVREWIANAEPMREGRGMMFNEGATMVRVGKEIDGERYTILALLVGNRPLHMEQSPFGAFQRNFALVCVGVVAGLMVLSQVFTRMLSKRIMRPMDALTDAANRVSLGEYTTPIVYKGDKEFEAVCEAFNQMQAALKQEQEKTAAYEKARTDMVASISHDLRTPLTSIKGYIKGLKDGVAQTREKQEQYLSIAYQKACDMDSLLSKLFYFSEMETTGLPLNLVKADLGEFAGQFATETNPELQEKQGNITVFKNSGLETLMDVEQMKRVLNNLTDNALKYVAQRPLQITIATFKEGDNGVLVFKDNGKGVEKEQLPHLFDQFYRGDEARGQQKGNGSGLGLYIVKYIVKLHGGTVEAESHNGLSIRISVPLVKGENL